MIHDTAIIEEGAEISADADIGAYCFVGRDVRLGAVVMATHSRIEGRTTIGDGSYIASFACVGGAPQIQGITDSQIGELIIGKNCVIREHATINAGSHRGEGVTRIGNDCLLMIGCHIAHDCELGDSVILANNAAMAGHVKIGDKCILGAACKLQQWVRIGAYSMIGACSEVDKDIIPYGMAVSKNRAGVEHLNWHRLEKDLGLDSDSCRVLRHFFKDLFKSGKPLHLTAESMIEEYQGNEVVQSILDFILSDSANGIATPKLRSKQ